MRHLSLLKEDGVTPMNFSTLVTAYFFQILEWDSDSPSNDPDELCLGDCFANSGIDNYCMEGQSHKFEIDTDSDSPTFGKILK
jgi:hypothetical protein